MDRANGAGAHAHADEIRNLNKEIRTHFTGIRRDKVRRLATASKGNVGLWKAVKLAKNLNNNDIPKNMSLGGLPVSQLNLANAFAEYFDSKVKSGVASAVINPDVVYNGKCKLIVQNRCFI